MIAGKVLMDRNCPEFLCDTADSAYADSKALIEKWHGTDRLLYAVTPRFAPTSTERIGNFAAGKEGDFIVLDLAATPLMARRMASTADPVERLFVLMMLGDDRAVFATHIMGRRESARLPALGAALPSASSGADRTQLD
jgi:cytosine/adenosine deaminase-related metal-dependent hydrolase